jgi:hypothetical protein
VLITSLNTYPLGGAAFSLIPRETLVGLPTFNRNVTRVEYFYNLQNT